VRIINGAFPEGWNYTLERFREEFLTSPHFQHDRIFFAVYRGECVGTATAWVGHHDGREMGRLHWVAVLPQHQRKGVAAALCIQALHNLSELGYREVMLGTMEKFQPAIQLYHRLGFQDCYHHHIIYEKQIE
jgi:GNAT superfamily N-acetyltransferase